MIKFMITINVPRFLILCNFVNDFNDLIKEGQSFSFANSCKSVTNYPLSDSIS